MDRGLNLNLLLLLYHISIIQAKPRKADKFDDF